MGEETFFALAAIIAEEMFGQTLPVFVINKQDAAGLRSGMALRVGRDGTIELEATPSE